MDKHKTLAWIKTALLATLGGGIAGSTAAAMDPSRYQIPRDLFSGKLWPYFFSTAAVTLGALLLKSPLGQSAMSAYRDSQAQLEADKKDLEDLKARFKPPDKDAKL